MSDYTELEEKINYSTHFVGFVIFLFLCINLIFQAISSNLNINIAGIIIYCVGILSVYATSFMYHFTKNKDLKLKFKTLDHMAIFLMIGGTYTPIVNKFIDNPLGTIFLTILWSILIIGIFMKFFFIGRFKTFSIILYVFLGCMVLFLINPILKNMPNHIFINIVLGGVTYLLGVIFYIQKKVKYTHNIWHLMVLIGSLFHYLAIYYTCK